MCAAVVAVVAAAVAVVAEAVAVLPAAVQHLLLQAVVTYHDVNLPTSDAKRIQYYTFYLSVANFLLLTFIWVPAIWKDSIGGIFLPGSY